MRGEKTMKYGRQRMMRWSMGVTDDEDPHQFNDVSRYNREEKGLG